MLRILMCVVVMLAVSRPVVSAQDHKVGTVTLEERSFETASGDVVKYEVGTVYVPENRANPESRVIGVGFARFRSIKENPDAPPVFQLPGGPGGSYLSRMKSTAILRRAYADISRFSRFTDVVLVDQRGFSEHGDVLVATLSLPSRKADKPFTVKDRVAAWETFARNVADDYKDRDVDLRGYTVKECADDVATLAEALGYEQITLNGTSFGSQWSFAVMRRHPELVARALLSGVEPLNHGFDMPSCVFAAVQRMWRSIDADPRFKPYLPEGGMAEAARVVIERLEREPIVVTIDIPNSDEKRQVGVYGPDDFPWNDPAHILELYHGRLTRWKQATFANMLPRRGRVSLIAPLIDSSLSTTPERRHRLWTDPAIRYLSRSNFAPYLATADIWPSPDVGDEFRTPIQCDIPVVFAHGTWDTQTPLENMFEIAPFFTNSRVIVADRGGHGVLGPISRELPDVGRQLIEFVETGDMDDIPTHVTLQPSRRFTPPAFEVDSQPDSEQ